ncbi:MAG: DnaJ domain-containing protein [Hespellia sp.]|nr:DnaJ domain-containing protein [Hespellia sp.]
MKDCTYYHMLGVSADATNEQIVAAKNFLVKKFHPDANLSAGFDTTSYMQNVLDAYQILSDPRTRRMYDRHIGNAVRRENTYGKAGQDQRSEFVTPNFAPYWEAANRINDLVSEAAPLCKNRFVGKTEESKEELVKLAEQLQPLMKTLEDGEIPRTYWHSHAINWILFQWSQNRDLPYALLFAMYDSYLEQRKTVIEKIKITTQASAFLSTLDRIIAIGIA